MRRIWLTAALLAAVLASCDRLARKAPADATEIESRAAPAAEAMRVRQAGFGAVGDAIRFSPTAGAASMVVRMGQASVEVDSLEPAIALVRALAGRVGGYVANTTMQTGRGQLRSASLEVKIPSGRFDDALTGLAPIGKLESVNVTAEDVGEEYVDVTARMANAQRLESRLIDLIATRTGKLKDVLDVERELARVREEIERFDGRLRYLKAHAALSTLVISVHEHIPVVGRAGSSVLGEAFREAWRNFVALVALFIRSLGLVIPLGAIGTAAWVAARRWRKTRVPRAAAA